MTGCHGVTQNGDRSSVTSPAFVLVETTNECVCRDTVFSTNMSSRPEVTLPPPHRRICRNCVRIFKLHGIYYCRTLLRTSTTPCRYVHVLLEVSNLTSVNNLRVSVKIFRSFIVLSNLIPLPCRTEI